MGLRTASVRHPHVEVMAPALTETNQTQTFKLPPDNQSASPINSSGKNGESLYIAREAATCKSLPNGKDLNNVFDTFAIESTELLLNGGDTIGTASDNNTTIATSTHSNSTDCGLLTMNNCSISMGDQDKMGLQKVSLDDVSDLLKGDTDVDQIFNNLPVGEADDIMQVFKSIDTTVDDQMEDQMFSTSDLNLNENDVLEEDLFNAVDVMNMSIDDQMIENENENNTCMKETQTKERLTEVGKKQAKLERKLDFLLRRIRKFQVHSMGQHVGFEVAGVYEHVHRTLKRCKELPKTADDALNLNNDTFSQATSMTTMTAESIPIPSASLEPLKPMSYSSTKNLIKKLELSNALLASNACRQKQAKYFGAGSTEAAIFRPPPPGQILTLPQWTSQEKQDLQNVSGYLESELRLVQEEVDSEATVSSSGGESCDESENYNNPHQQYLPIHKRAAWKYAIDRSAIASKWTWLQSQVADLEYKIRQHTDLHKKIRHSKEGVKLGGLSPPHEVPSSPNCLNGYRGQLPGASPLRNGESVSPNGTAKSTTTEYQCARTRPLISFRKRKLLQITGLHAVSKKAARPSSTRCGCIPPSVTCALCTGRTDPTYPRDHSEYMSRFETLGLLDPSYHPVFSLNEDAPASLHMEAIMKTSDWQQRSSRANLKMMKFIKGERGEKTNNATANSERERPRAKNNEHRKKYNRLIKPSTANALTAKIKNRYRGRKPIRHPSIGRMKKRSRMSSAHSLGSDGADDEVEALGISGRGKFDSPSSSPLLTQTISGFQKRNRVDSYDIDNIIIPYSVAASTRVEKLQYKEILTPKWRIAEGDAPNPSKHDVKNNGIVKTSQDKDTEKDNEEDLSDLSVVIRHEKSEQEERKKFLSFLKLPIGYGRSRANRRTDSRAESSGANTPDPMSPAPMHNNTSEPMQTNASNSNDKDNSPLASPPATPMPAEEPIIPSISALRRRTISQTRLAREKDETRSNTPEIEIPPYEKRVFPISEELYEKMVRSMPDDHKLKTNIHSQDSAPNSPPVLAVQTFNQGKDKEFQHDSESTESAFGDEDPNDPEWDGENSKDRYTRTR